VGLIEHANAQASQFREDKRVERRRKVVIMTTYFGFAVSDSMFDGECEIVRTPISPEMAKEIINNGIEVCLNPSHQATIAAMNAKFSIHCEIPAKAPRVQLERGDKLIIMQVGGLPRLDATRHEYTHAEIEKATFAFSVWTRIH
jgi:hypothetical protein